MDSHALRVNHDMQRIATLAQQVLKRAKARKLKWPLPPQLQRRTFPGSTNEDACLADAFASVAEHMGCISAACENYYCSVPPFQFEECEIAHIFRYHSREASENLLRAFENEEIKNAPTVEEPEYPETEPAALIPAKTSASKEIKNAPIVEDPEYPETEPASLIPAKTSASKEIKNAPTVEEPEYPETEPASLIPAKSSASKEVCIEVSPGTYTISASSHDDTIKQTHLVNVQPGESVNLVFHL